MNLVDQYCLDCFPELLEVFSIHELEQASALGLYIFHEDYFICWIIKPERSSSDLKRISSYIEYLAGSENIHLQNLAQIGMIESLINSNYVEIIPFLGKKSLILVSKASATTKFDKKLWNVC